MIINTSPEALAKMRAETERRRSVYGSGNIALSADEALALIDALEEARDAYMGLVGAVEIARKQALAEAADFVRRHGEEELADAIADSHEARAK